MIFKKSNIFIFPVLNELINQAFYKGLYPSSKKVPKVIQIFKSGSKTLLRNYRPNSLISNLNELIEQVVNNCLYNFYS